MLVQVHQRKGRQQPLMILLQAAIANLGVAEAALQDAKGHPTLGAHGRFTALAFGGGVDLKLTKRISLRAVDVEYQYWPLWGNSTLSPYGASMGIGYKIF